MVKNLYTVNPSQPLKVLCYMTIWIAVLMVSGTFGFRGIAYMALGDVHLEVQQLFQMSVQAMTIVTGIMIGYTIMIPASAVFNQNSSQLYNEPKP